MLVLIVDNIAKALYACKFMQPVAYMGKDYKRIFKIKNIFVATCYATLFLHS